MIRNDLIDGLARAFPGITKRDMSTVVNTFFGCLAEGLERGDAVELRGFGRLAVKKRRPIQARNPRTAVPVDLPERWAIAFKPAGGLIRALNPDSEEKQPFSALTSDES
jgi:nucleoid DNA-binding protein